MVMVFGDGTPPTSWAAHPNRKVTTRSKMIAHNSQTPTVTVHHESVALGVR